MQRLDATRLVASVVLLFAMGTAACSEKAEDFFYITTGDLGVSVTGLPLGATVTVLHGNDVVETATVGAFEHVFEFLPVGDYTVTVTPPEGSQCTPQSQQVSIPSDDFVGITFDCTPPTGDLTVNVTGTTSPVTVGISGPSTRTGMVSGTQTFRDLPEGSYSVSASSPPGFVCSPQMQIAQVVAGQTTTVEIECVQQTGSIQVVVSGGPASVTVSGQGITASMTVGSSPVTFGNLPAGAYEVSIAAQSGFSCAPVSRTVTVPAGGTASATFVCMATPPTTAQIAGTRAVSYAIHTNTCGVADPPPFEATANFQATSATSFNVAFIDLPGFPIRIMYDPDDGTGSGTTDPVPQSSFDVTESWFDLKFSFGSSGGVTMTGQSEVVYRLSGMTAEFCRLGYGIQF